MPNHYMFVVSGKGGKQFARDIVSKRFAEGLWPLNARTPHRSDLAPGDQVLVYAAAGAHSDPDRGCFIAVAEIRAALIESARQIEPVASWIGLRGKPLFDVPLARTTFLSMPLHAQPIVRRLSFVRNKEQWGTYFQGGVRKVPASDFELVLAVAATRGSSVQAAIK